MEALEIAVPLAVAFASALLLTVPTERLAQALGAIDRPNSRGVNQRLDIPLWGGLAVAVAFGLGVVAALAVAARAEDMPRLSGLAAGAAIVVLAGLWDDRFGMSAWPKLTLQLLAAGLAVAGGFEISRFTSPYSLEVVELPRWLVWPASLLWIVGITNAVNLLDGLDGLAAGVGAIIAATLTWIAFQAQAPLGVCMGLALLGALLGFLPHNFSPARLFLGDTGSMFVGFTLALLALEGYRRVSLITFVVPLLALAVPILDTTLSIVRRVRMGTPILAADRMHMHHRLLDSEGSTRAAVLQFYFLTAAFCLLALSFTRLQGVTALVFLLAVGALTIRLLWNLGLLRAEAGDDPSDGVRGGGTST